MIRFFLAMFLIAVAVVLLAADPAEAGAFKKDNWSLDLPEKWAVDTDPVDSRPGATVFARDGDDYPLARIRTLPPGTKLGDSTLARLVNPTETYDSYSTTRDDTFQLDGMPARRLDFVWHAHADSYVNSVVAIDPGGKAPLIVLDIIYNIDDEKHPDYCDPYNVDGRASEAILESGSKAGDSKRNCHKVQAEMDHLLASFRVARAAAK